MSKTIDIGDYKYPIELDETLAPDGWYLKGNSMVDFNDEELRKAAAQVGNATKRIQERMIKDAMFGEGPPYSPFVSTARMRPSVASPPPFGSFVPLLTVTTSPYVVEKKKRSRERKRGFWGKFWASLTDLNPWPYSPIEYYEFLIPAIMFDRPNNRIICHPSLEHEIKKAVNEGSI